MRGGDDDGIFFSHGNGACNGTAKHDYYIYGNSQALCCRCVPQGTRDSGGDAAIEFSGVLVFLGNARAAREVRGGKKAGLEAASITF